MDTHVSWPEKKVLLPTDWIGQANWPELTVTLNITRDQVRNGPKWDPREPISRAFEEQLARYYARRRLGTPENSTEQAKVAAGHEGLSR